MESVDTFIFFFIKPQTGRGDSQVIVEQGWSQQRRKIIASTMREILSGSKSLIHPSFYFIDASFACTVGEHCRNKKDHITGF